MKKIIVIICCIVCFSCVKSKAPSLHYDHIIKWNPQELLNEAKSEINFDYIILGDENLLNDFRGEISKIIVKNNLYIILDGNHSYNTIFIFDEHGNFKNKINKRGRGPGEFLNLADISVKGDTIFALNQQSISKVLKYNFQGDFIGETPLSIPNLSAISATEFGYIGYRQMMGADEYDNKYAIYYFDHNGILTDNLFPFNKIAPHISYSKMFVENEQNFIFNQFFWNSIIKFDRKKKDYTSYYIDFGRNNIPEDKLDKTNEILSEHNYSFFTSPPLFINNYIIGSIKDKSKSFTYFIDLETSETFIDGGELIPLPAGLYQAENDNTLIVPLSYTAYENWAGSSKLPIDVKNRIEDGDIVLLLYDLNKLLAH